MLAKFVEFQIHYLQKGVISSKSLQKTIYKLIKQLCGLSMPKSSFSCSKIWKNAQNCAGRLGTNLKMLFWQLTF